MKKLNKKITIKLNELILRSYLVSMDDITDEKWALNTKKNWGNKNMSYCISDYLNEKRINNKALKINNKDIIYTQIDSDYDINWELNLYLKFGNEEKQRGSISLPTDFDLNLKWYEIDEVKSLITDYLEDEEADYEVINYE